MDNAVRSSYVFFFFPLLIILCIFFQSISRLHAQANKIDSVLLLLKKEKTDTAKITHLNFISRQYLNRGAYDSVLYYANLALELIEPILGKEHGDIEASSAYNSMGVAYIRRGEYVKALDYLLKALSIIEQLEQKAIPSLKLKYTELKPLLLGNIGVIYNSQRVYDKALDYYLRALKMAEEVGDKDVIVMQLANLGSLYNFQASAASPDSLEYRDRLNKKALEYYFRALKMNEDLGIPDGITINTGNIGTIYYSQGAYDNALLYTSRALKMAEASGDKNGIAMYLGNIGSIYSTIGKFIPAEEYLLKAIALSDSIGAKQTVRDCEETLSQVYDSTGRCKLALVHYKRSVLLKESLFNEENQQQMDRKEMTYEFEKKEFAGKAEQDKKDAVAAEESRRQKVVIWSVTGGLLLAFLFGMFLWRSLRITRRQKHVIETKSLETEAQKKMLENKNMNITDSIMYAKKIQESFILGEKEIGKILPYESFVFYRPKDIVSGDFYWFSSVIDNGNPLYVVAAADCTGHGVPGAFLSMMGNMLLNKIVNEKHITDPAAILKEIHSGILTSFRSGSGFNDSQDGMDMALCVIDSANKIIRYAGAKNPVCIVRQSTASQKPQLEIIKADAFSLGGKIRGSMSSEVAFTNHEIPVVKGMSFYLFSDGYKDQFNPKQKLRIGSRQFMKIIAESAHLTMVSQKNALAETFDAWKGDYEQIDDVLVIGVKF